MKITLPGQYGLLRRLRRLLGAERITIRRRLLFSFAALFVLLATFLIGGLAHRQGIWGATWGLVIHQQLPDNVELLRRQTAGLAAPRFPTITIDMGFEEFEKIRAKREAALARHSLLADDEDFVNADFTFDRQRFPVRIRMAGDSDDHRDAATVGDKWSYRIVMKGDGRYSGMKAFSIRHPSTRDWINEFGYHLHLQHEGILANRYDFVNVVFNGKPMGIYTIEEHFRPEMLEAQGRRVGVIMTWDERTMWELFSGSRYPKGLYGGFIPHGALGTQALLDTYYSGIVDEDPVLAEQAKAAAELLRRVQTGEVRPSDVFDVEKVATWLAVSELWHARHGLSGINPRFYFNPITDRLEPIGYDGILVMRKDEYPTFESFEPDLWWPRVNPRTPIFSWVAGQLLRDPVIAGAFISELGRVSDPDYLPAIESALGPRLNSTLRSLHREFPELESPWPHLDLRSRFIRTELRPPRLVVAYGADVAETSDMSHTAVSVAALTTAPVQILGFRIGEGRLVAGVEEPGDYDGYSRVLPGKMIGVPLTFRRFLVPREWLALRDESQPLTVVARLFGASNEVESEVDLRLRVPERLGRRPNTPSMEEVLGRHPFLQEGRAAEDRALIVSPGVWDVDGDLVLPADTALYLGPDVSLRFQSGAVMVVAGPTLFRGTPDAPVTLEPAGASWGGVIVMADGQESYWSNVIVRDTEGISRGGWTTTGGLTFYESPIVMRDVIIAGSTAEDAVNVIAAHVDFARVQISETRSDGLDGGLRHRTNRR